MSPFRGALSSRTGPRAWPQGFARLSRGWDKYVRMGCPIMTAQPFRPSVASPLRLAAILALALGLSGCASVSVPFGDFFERDPEPLYTASVGAPAPVDEDARDAPMPAEITAIAPIDGPRPEPADSAPNPVDELLASLPQRETRVSLTQSDLNAMGRALTHVLSSDEDTGTFAWSHQATGRSGLMTPFRQLSATDQGSCRVVSVEITDTGHDTILLADACLQGENWVFVTPQPGELL